VALPPVPSACSNLETVRESVRVTIGDGWRELAFSPSGDKLYFGNGSRASLTEFTLNGANLSIQRKIDLDPGEKPGTAHLIADLLAEKRPFARRRSGPR
jgi:hypothetical protein